MRQSSSGAAEILERRTLFAIDPIFINFQLDGAPVPDGYLADTGALYGDRGNTYSYGWSSDHTDVSRDRNVNPDQLLDTLIHFHVGQTWEISIPNGTYLVRVSVGDAANASIHTINAEGTSLFSNVSLNANEFSNVERSVTVADGRLTLDQGALEEKSTRINYIEIREIVGGENQNPLTPTITEPLFDGKVVNPEDVHMEAPNYSDPDGDAHLNTDWEIWTVNPSQRVWFAQEIRGVERVHVHLGDGRFINARAGQRSLAPETEHILRVRFRDARGGVSDFAERRFVTGTISQTFPMELDDIAPTPTPSLRTTGGAPVNLPSTGEPGRLFLESAANQKLLELVGAGGANQVVNPETLPLHVPVRLRIAAGSQAIITPESTLTFFDETGVERSIYLPPLAVAAGQTLLLWVDDGGSTYYAEASQTTPDFSNLAQGAIVPFRSQVPGYRVEEFASGLQLPTNIAFIPNAGTAPTDPYLYVTELYGAIKVVYRNGSVGDYATNLLNFNPTGDFPGSGEQGVSGIAVDPITGDVFASMLYSSIPGVEAAPHYPKVVRFTSNNGGRSASTQTVILDMPGESMGQSHQISNVSIGPDGLLYVHVGDGFDAARAQDLNSYRGKVLRMNLDGTPPTDNPFYNGGGRDSLDYIWAYGVRNPFGGTWQQSSGRHFTVENGPSVDRLSETRRGENYGWDGSDASMFTKALYNWNPAEAPVNIAFVEPGNFGGSGFPQAFQNDAFVTLSGGTYSQGPGVKKIARFDFDANGNYLGGGPQTFITYAGNGRASFVGLAAGPDGLYFTDLYKDLNAVSPIERGARLLRVVATGNVDFAADIREATPNLAVKFTDLSNLNGATAWNWSFGDGATSTERNPVHVYEQVGNYSVTLRVTTATGVQEWRKSNYITVQEAGGGPGLKAEYYGGREFDQLLLSRVDARIANNWGAGSPDPSVPTDNFSVRWSGQITVPTTGSYTFYPRADDGVRLFVNDVQIVDAWRDQSATEFAASVNLTANTPTRIRMEFYENGGDAVAELRYDGPGITKRFVPASAFSQPNPVNQPPRILSVTQRLTTMNQAISLVFHENVGGSLSADDIQLTGDNGVDLTGSNLGFTYDAATRTATLTFPTLEFGRLPRGSYALRVRAGGVTDLAGALLDGDANNVAGDDFLQTLSITPQDDPDRDGDYDLADFAILRSTFSNTGNNLAADLDDDGDVDFVDFATLRRVFNRRF